MASTKSLARFTATPGPGGFKLHIEDEDGETLELTATRDQLDVITDSLDDLLSEDDSDEDDDEDDEDDPAAPGRESDEET